MLSKEQSAGRDNKTDQEKYIHKLTIGYINRLDGLPNSRLLLLRSSHPALANILNIKSVDERVKSEKEKFYKGFTSYIENFTKYFSPDEPNNMGVFTRILCVLSGVRLIGVANHRFNEVPFLRTPLIQSAGSIFQYGADVSKKYGEEIEQSWLNDFMLNVVMQSSQSWEAGGREEFAEKIAQFREPTLVSKKFA